MLAGHSKLHCPVLDHDARIRDLGSNVVLECLYSIDQFVSQDMWKMKTAASRLCCASIILHQGGCFLSNVILMFSDGSKLGSLDSSI